MRSKFKLISICITLLILMFSYQNCTSAFESVNDLDSIIGSLDVAPSGEQVVPVVASGRFQKLIDESSGAISLRCLDSTKETSPRLPGLLTKNEIKNGLKDILAIENPLDGYPEQNGAGGYEQSNKVFISETYFFTISYIAESIATQFNKTLKNKNNANWSCDINVDCPDLIKNKISKHLWRRPLTAKELLSLNSIEAQYDGAEEKTWQLLKFIISAPQFFTKNVTLKSSSNGSLVNLWDYAASMSFILGDSFIPLDLFEGIETGNITSQAQIYNYAKSYIEKEDVQKNIVENFLGIWLDYKHALSSTQTFDGEIVKDIASKSSQMVASILKDNLPLGNIINNSSDGILNSKLFARSTFGSEKDSDPVKRGIYVLKGLLCYSFPDLSAATEEQISAVSNNENFPVNGSNMDIIKFHSQNAQCSICHNSIDPAAIGLENIGPFGNFREIYPNGSTIEFTNTPFGGSTYSNQAEYTDLISKSFDLKHCFSEKLHLKVNALASTAQTNSCFMSELYQGQQNLGLKDLILNVLKTSLVSKTSKPIY